MKPDADGSTVHRRFFHGLLLVVTLALAWVLWPYFSAVFWGVMLALLFHPVQRRLVSAFGQRPNLAAFVTLMIVLVLVIVPVILIAMRLVSDIGNVYDQIRSGQIDLAASYGQAVQLMPSWAQPVIEHFGLHDVAALQQRITDGATQISRFVGTQALWIGQNTFQFIVSLGVMLYLVFFLLRDGPAISRLIQRALPLDEAHKAHLLAKFTTVARATIKGNVAVAAVQGVLGGAIFAVLGIQSALLWGVVMAVLSLLPAVGASIVWAPAAVYFVVSDHLWKGVILIVFGVFVIGLVDNILRPILVGKDTRMPDWVVLISTLGGMSVLGINGFVIGPLVAALFMASWSLFAQEEDDNSRS
ncbi:AI-2E family transporter [Pararobbsia silviterrae]|uniref:AI-2E family transporter n=1 Tax=Pararobbsia silviterrae TaxID=1792498 RepID=A0A494XJ30_9BURK|nr:AI-2E family transporter [Pararobbsia silviterrae]RKP49721.1 AI-2E family transporter [Pararobbsia silviterrae]